MKKIAFISLIILIVVAGVAIAGCSSKTAATSDSSAAAGAGASTTAPAAAATASAATCPAVTTATSWTGKWVSWSNSDTCYDGRQYLYPATAENPDPWGTGVGGSEDFPITFTQTGCDVTGTVTVGENGTAVAPSGCPISFTGKVDSTGTVSGTWKAYCNIMFTGTDKTLDSGVFSLRMSEDGSTFIGRFTASDADVATYVSESCSSANSNWVGKRG